MTSPLRRMLAGGLAGAAGTLAMDLLWYRRYRAGGGQDGFMEWEFATSTASFEEASAPGKVGQRVAHAAGVDLPDELAGETTNVVHWATGIGYGAGHGLLQHERGALSSGAVTGMGAFTTSYALLGLMGIYRPIWEYDAGTLWEDLSAHLLFGLTTGVLYRTLTRG